jgi:hypothetical protein
MMSSWFEYRAVVTGGGRSSTRGDAPVCEAAERACRRECKF